MESLAELARHSLRSMTPEDIFFFFLGGGVHNKYFMFVFLLSLGPKKNMNFNGESLNLS